MSSILPVPLTLLKKEQLADIMSSIDIQFTYDPHLYVPVRTWDTDDLSAWVKDWVYWVTYQNNLHSAYHLLSDNGAEAPVEFINHQWHFLVWKDKQGYLTNQECLIKKHQYHTRWYDKREPSLISPLEPREPLPAYDSPPMDSSSNQESMHEETDEDIEVRHGINYDNEVLAQCAKLFTTREPIEPETITLAEAMDQMMQQTADYDFTLLDHEPMQISSTSAVSTTLTMPAQPFQVS
jgi:hypothetical protein